MKQSIFQRWVSLREEAEKTVQEVPDDSQEMLLEGCEPIHHDISITSNQRSFRWYSDSKKFSRVKP